MLGGDWINHDERISVEMNGGNGDDGGVMMDEDEDEDED
jgi:hypothetical protein